MVCSDIAARGLDIPETAHVVMFDFPLNPVDYLHRAGRCGRAGRKGGCSVECCFWWLSIETCFLTIYDVVCSI